MIHNHPSLITNTRRIKTQWRGRIDSIYPSNEMLFPSPHSNAIGPSCSQSCAEKSQLERFFKDSFKTTELFTKTTSNSNCLEGCD